jgi:hypothetical protein
LGTFGDDYALGVDGYTVVAAFNFSAGQEPLAAVGGDELKAL